jgi:hypothetical protein
LCPKPFNCTVQMFYIPLIQIYFCSVVFSPLKIKDKKNIENFAYTLTYRTMLYLSRKKKVFFVFVELQFCSCKQLNNLKKFKTSKHYLTFYVQVNENLIHVIWNAQYFQKSKQNFKMFFKEFLWKFCRFPKKHNTLSQTDIYKADWPLG